MNCTRMDSSYSLEFSRCKIAIARQGVDKFCSPNRNDDLCLFFCLYPSSKSGSLQEKRPLVLWEAASHNWPDFQTDSGISIRFRFFFKNFVLNLLFIATKTAILKITRTINYPIVFDKICKVFSQLYMYLVKECCVLVCCILVSITNFCI